MFKSIKLTTLWRYLLLVAVLVPLAACHTIEGAGKDIEDAGEEIQDASREAHGD